MFYGDDPMTSGMIDAIPDEYRGLEPIYPWDQR